MNSVSSSDPMTNRVACGGIRVRPASNDFSMFSAQFSARAIGLFLIFSTFKMTTELVALGSFPTKSRKLGSADARPAANSSGANTARAAAVWATRGGKSCSKGRSHGLISCVCQNGISHMNGLTAPRPFARYEWILTVPAQGPNTFCPCSRRRETKHQREQV